jgi:hypothetical protein
MTRRNNLIATAMLLVALVVIAALLIPSMPPRRAVAPTTEPTDTTPAETPVTVIPLTAPLDSPDAEISGLAWHGDSLILLPQYPNFAGQAGDGDLYALPREAIEAFLDGDSDAPLEPTAITLDAPGINELDGFEGYEAIAFDGDTVFMTIETAGAQGPLGYVVRGTMDGDVISLDPDTLSEIAPQSASENKTDEALTLIDNEVVTFYEVNGAALNDNPMAQVFSLDDLASQGEMEFPAIEFRVTDATDTDSDGCFWMISYNFPGDADLQTDDDPIVETYGEGATHAQTTLVERLIELCASGGSITFADRAPLYLELLPDALARNWEGIARLGDRGFLLATDKFPETILGFVALPED